MKKEQIYKIALTLGSLIIGLTGLMYPINYGLDLRGGVSILIEASPVDNTSLSSKDMQKLAEVMERRIDSLGINEPVIRVVGSNRLSVEIAGINDVEEAIDTLGRTALLEFRIKEYDDTLGEALLTGKDLKKAEVIYTDGFPSVALYLTNEGAEIFYQITRNNIGRQLAITLDGEIQSAPVIKGAISTGKPVISSNDFSFSEANKLALLLSAGSLPSRIEVLEVRLLSASLGQEALDKSFRAGTIAMILIVLFMMLWYFLPGLLASLSLLIFGLLTLGIMKFLGATLTLPGIAGFILSLGMAVDANVIIFAMIKEELSKGNGLRSSVVKGFSKSLSSIIDSNITTLIITFVLFMLGTGPIKGYSVTLSIGILVSMFSSIFITRFLIELVFDLLKIESNKSFGIINLSSNFKFIEKSILIFLISFSAIIFSGYSLITKGLNYGIDFVGGTAISVQFDEIIDEDEFKGVMSNFKQNELKEQIQFSNDSSGNRKIALIKTVELNNREKGDLYSHIRRNYGSFKVNSEDAIGASVGNNIKINALIALLIGALMIIFYISLRFKLVFAISAVLALLHDIFIAVGLSSYLGYEINSTFVVAILTILGYSINDTVVVFDKIRDNLKSVRKLKDAINISINQVSVRSFNTSLTTLLSICALLFSNINSLYPFLMTLLIGIVAGTYSSLFVTGPLLYLMSNKKER